MYAAGSLSPGQIIVILVIVLLLFGGKRLRNFGSDLGEAIKGFKNSMGGEDKDKENKENETPKNLEQNNSQTNVQQNEKNEHKQ